MYRTTPTQAIQQEIAKGPFADSWESLKGYHIPAWYENAKFGIFIHWGVYSVPAFGSEWYPRNMYLQGSPEYQHHLETYGEHTKFGYKDFIPQFTAENFDADEWANLFRRAGAQFVMPVAEHHDGFTMYDTAFSDWKATNMGPKRDVIQELSVAVRKQWLTFGLSSHRAEHWWFFEGGMAFDSDVQDVRYADFYGPAQLKSSQPNQEFLDDWLARSCELVDKFQPQIFWFDWWIEEPAFQPYLQKFAAYYYNRAAEWGREVAINYKFKAFPEGTAVFDVERGQLSDIRSEFWQTDTAIAKNSWSYVQDQQYKTADAIIGDLVDIVSKNGALLLNIGPRSDGTIPAYEQELLLNVGRWLKLNGEAIYSTRPWKIFGEGPTPVESGSFSDSDRVPFTGRDMRFTTNGETLYAIVLAQPENAVVNITSLSTTANLYTQEIAKVELLGRGEASPLQGRAEALQFQRNAEGLSVILPDDYTNQQAFALRITPAK